MFNEEITVVFEPEGMKVKAVKGETILSIAREAGGAIRSECGGRGICGQCKVIVRDREHVNSISSLEKKHLSPQEISAGYRLACQTVALGDLVIEIPRESRVRERKIQVSGVWREARLKPLVKKVFVKLPRPTLSDTTPDLERLVEALAGLQNLDNVVVDYDVLRELPARLREGGWAVTVALWGGREVIAVEAGDTTGEVYGIALDVGSSKLVVHLVDLKTGKLVGVASSENPQISYGEDVISRITFAITNENGREQLQRVVIERVSELITRVCSENMVSASNVYELVAVGNTAMHHFFLGIQPRYLANSPYVPGVKGGVQVKAKNLGLKVNPNMKVYFLPVIAGFVGADAVGCILSTGIHESEEASMLIDIGTNTEVILGNREELYACSCASGPAFEGAHIKHGMKAVSGAIEAVQIKGSEVKFKTIGDSKPVGICGSGIIDALAEMLKEKIIDYKGRFRGFNNPRMLKSNGEECFVIAWEGETETEKRIVITQRDIREIQLAKAAIQTGWLTLLRKRGMQVDELDQLLVAGAFGNYINPDSARRIGLFPGISSKKIRFVGNAAIMGARMCLISAEKRKEAEKIAKKVNYVELAAEPNFHRTFASSMYLPYREISL